MQQAAEVLDNGPPLVKMLTDEAVGLKILNNLKSIDNDKMQMVLVKLKPWLGWNYTRYKNMLNYNGKCAWTGEKIGNIPK